MNIAYVCREYGHITGGGIGTYIVNVVREMSQRGHEIFLVTDCVSETNSHLIPPGVHVVPVAPAEATRSGNFFTWNQEYSFRVLASLKALTQEFYLDVIEFAEYGGEGFASIRAKRLMNQFAGASLVVKCHTPLSLLFDINEYKSLFVSTLCDIALEDYSVRNADLVTSPSRSLADFFENRVGRKDIRICPYPMNLPISDRSRTFSDEQVKRIRFIGSIQVRKGVDIFIEAAKLVLERRPDYLFELWGEIRNASCFGKDYKSILEKKIPEDLRDRILFRGSIPYGNINDLFLNSCMVALPSRWENWANVCLEAMSQGCVVLASRAGGMAEMINDNIHGVLIDPLNPRDLAEKIIQLADDRPRMEVLSEAAIERSRVLCDPLKVCEAIEANYAAVSRMRPWKAVDKPPLVSVIIPHFNQGEYLVDAVASVKASTYPNIEIVVVDDDSTDVASRQIFDRICGVKKIRKPNGGLSSARNCGIEASCGKYFLPLDADDKIHPNYIVAAVSALENNPSLGYVSCHAQNFGDLDSVYIPIGYVPALMTVMNTDGKCANLFRRETHNASRRYDEAMVSYEDWDFLIQLHAAGIEGDVLPDELFFYRRHTDSMVYQTANPLRADLVQYMMIKHQKLFSPYASLLAITLARLWKESELRAEYLEDTISSRGVNSNLNRRDTAQVYWSAGTEFTETASRRQDYNRDERSEICLRIEFNTNTLQLRFDPGQHRGTYFISNLVIRDIETKEVLWNYLQKGSVCQAAGDAMCFDHEGVLVVQSHAKDPQLILPALPAQGRSMFELSCSIVSGLWIEAETIKVSRQMKGKSMQGGYLPNVIRRFLSLR